MKGELIKNGGHCYNDWYYNTATGACQEGTGFGWLFIVLVFGVLTYLYTKDD